jgi:hypothetical protein
LFAKSMQKCCKKLTKVRRRAFIPPGEGNCSGTHSFGFSSLYTLQGRSSQGGLLDPLAPSPSTTVARSQNGFMPIAENISAQKFVADSYAEKYF